MNKTTFYIILILMGGSIIGISALQVSYLKSSIEINEESFDKNVLAALNKVSNQLLADETQVYNIYVNNGFASKTNKGRLDVGIPESVDYKTEKEAIQIEFDGVPQEFDEDWNFVSSPSREEEMFKKVQEKVKAISSTPVADRIDIEYLDNYLSDALKNNGVKTPYNYGVYSSSKKKFVIEDGHFLVIDDAPNSSMKIGFDNLFHSKYNVDLFSLPGGRGAAGKLMVYFPGKGQFLFSTIWRQVLSVLFFTLIVLFCFVYTIQVILRQKKISEMKTDFINNMTHEFKTPIATISLASDSITNSRIISDPAKVNRFADIIRQENKRMNNQVEKVLQIALVEKRNFELKISKVNVHDLVEMALTSTGLIIESRGGQTKSSLNATNSTIEADQTHIANLINNLMDNANKYSPENPIIEVNTHDKGEGIIIEFIDNGIGMSKDVLKNIFEKFYRVHTGNRHDVKGFGLGLSYVKAIVDAHNGRIEVQSDLGKGSKFSVFLPKRHI